jgi:hypothetical protein
MKLRFMLAFAVLASATACSKSSDPAPAAAADPIASGASGPGAAGGEKDKPRKHGDKHNPMAADAVPLTLDVSVGGAVTTWNKDMFDKVTRYNVGSDGDARDTWSMRDLATTLVGSGAHVVSVTGEGGTKPMDAVAWADAKQTPILHTTRRGTLKFTWADSTGAWGDTVVKDVTKIEIAR